MSTTFSRMRAFARSNTGSTAVEFAFVAPLLFLLIFGIIEFGRAWWAKNSLEYAADRAARYAVVCDGACPLDSAVASYAASEANQVYGQSVGFTINHPDLTNPNTICVNYSLSFAPWFVGGLDILQSTLTFTGKSCRTG
jgi:TadE-like protein